MDISATEAARRFSEILDAVEHRGASFVILRKGHPVARMSPATNATGGSIKEILHSHAPDGEWEKELREVRAVATAEDRRWTA